jgi:hypothetical protein
MWMWVQNFGSWTPYLGVHPKKKVYQKIIQILKNQVFDHCKDKIILQSESCKKGGIEGHCQFEYQGQNFSFL